MKRCPKCGNLMPQEETRCIRCGNDTAAAPRKAYTAPVEVRSIPDFPSRIMGKRNWRRTLAGVLTSKLLFLIVCAAGAFAGWRLSDDLFLEAGGHQGADRRMIVVAMAPEPGGGKAVARQVAYGDLGEFKAINPGYSFLLPPGAGQVDNPSAKTSTRYAVQAAGEGKVLVETRFSHDLTDLFGRYEATERDVRPLFFKSGSNLLFALTFGFALASLLGLAGVLLEHFAP
jgi:hypothetical protein